MDRAETVASVRVVAPHSLHDFAAVGLVHLRRQLAERLGLTEVEHVSHDDAMTWASGDLNDVSYAFVFVRSDPDDERTWTSGKAPGCDVIAHLRCIRPERLVIVAVVQEPMPLLVRHVRNVQPDAIVWDYELNDPEWVDDVLTHRRRSASRDLPLSSAQADRWHLASRDRPTGTDHQRLRDRLRRWHFALWPVLSDHPTEADWAVVAKQWVTSAPTTVRKTLIPLAGYSFGQPYGRLQKADRTATVLALLHQYYGFGRLPADEVEEHGPVPSAAELLQLVNTLVAASGDANERLLAALVGTGGGATENEWEMVSINARTSPDDHRTFGLQTPVEAGSTLWVEVAVRNLGDAWARSTLCPLMLGTSEPRDRTSALLADGWVSPDRPAELSELIVEEGGIGHFRFPVRVPETQGLVRETFELVRENRRWMAGSPLAIELLVIAPKAASRA